MVIKMSTITQIIKNTFVSASPTQGPTIVVCIYNLHKNKNLFILILRTTQLEDTMAKKAKKVAKKVAKKATKKAAKKQFALKRDRKVPFQF